ncbi:hypothetical protein FA10DRAFT_301098 [Acaromyces ingoldii]|uniref:Transmembrane protein n=1 Tax=Acaromyces ingoldii TaxID=215250 RepID=A0A316YPX3_9BASI|nr:hypothetical protein FA10DRAFT_301098 [Acaromyces ingoldii]PWN89795.1 hypothetical protein FA10DRAFT_301098 [Acaromyces ingoldii]
MKRLVFVLLFVAAMLASLATNAGCLDSQRDESAPMVKRVLGSGQHEEDEDRRSDESAPMVKRGLGTGQHEEEEDRPASSKPGSILERMARDEQQIQKTVDFYARYWRDRYRKAALELREQRGINQESHGGQETEQEGDGDDDGSIAVKASARCRPSIPQHESSDESDESAPMFKRGLGSGGSGQHEEGEDRPASSRPGSLLEQMAHDEQQIQKTVDFWARYWRDRYRKAALELRERREINQERHGGQEIKREGDDDDDGSIAYWLNRFEEVTEELERTPGSSRKREWEHEEEEKRRQDLARLMPPPAGVPNAQRFRRLSSMSQTPEREKKKQPKAHPNEGAITTEGSGGRLSKPERP